MRAREPDQDGFVERDGVRTFYEVFGSSAPAIVLLTSWAVVHARQWKAQIPYLARHFRVVTVEGRGNGRSDRPQHAAAYADREHVADALAVMDATGTDRAVVAGISLGGRRALQLAAWHPERVLGVVAIGAALPWGPPDDFDEVLPTNEGPAKFNRHYWLRDHRGFLEFFFSLVFTEPHSTWQIEQSISWGLETTPETLVLTVEALRDFTTEEAEATCRKVRCPVLVVHGDADQVIPYDRGVAQACWTGGALATVQGGGHNLALREPVRTNLLLREFTEAVAGWRAKQVRWCRGLGRRRRALFVCSPIGLGHALRDVAIADALRRLQPDLEIDWLAQHPVTAVLEHRGERIHPASRWLSSESAHIESQSGEHELHMFQAWRRMDEILVANFMVFHDLVMEEHYDLWVGDEAWDLDHFLHENPELKRAAFVWLTDFVGWLPMPDGGPAEAALSADYNAEMVEHVERYPWLRDRSVFVGNPDDLVSDPLGPGLPGVRDWTERHFGFAGYVTGFEPPGDRGTVRAELGYSPDERICLVSVGGSGVGTHLLRRVLSAYPLAEKQLPGLRMIVVAGPRIDPASLPACDGVDVHGFVPDLYRHFAACDLAVVQGGLSTCMELVANSRPFIYFPLAHHFEQQRLVPHRLAQYHAGRRMDYGASEPDRIAEAIAAEINREADYRPVETDGAAKAAAMIAELL